MASPSPSDHCWVIGFTPQGCWITPVLRAAIRAEWDNAERMAKSRFGDASLAHELIEEAIGRTAQHLRGIGPVKVEEAREILARHYRNAVRRRTRSEGRLSLRGTAADFEYLAPATSSTAPAVEAGIDIKSMLRDTPPDLQHAMLMRYGARSRWREVAEEIHKSSNAARKSCQKELNRIRRKLGIQEREES
jgi:DNA-directed RNA polymerase specialized sigma24 family protein